VGRKVSSNIYVCFAYTHIKHYMISNQIRNDHRREGEAYVDATEYFFTWFHAEACGDLGVLGPWKTTDCST